MVLFIDIVVLCPSNRLTLNANTDTQCMLQITCFPFFILLSKQSSLILEPITDFRYELIPCIQFTILLTVQSKQLAYDCFQRFDDFFRITAVYANLEKCP